MHPPTGDLHRGTGSGSSVGRRSVDGFLDRGAVRFRPIGIDDLSAGQRRLGHELHSPSVMSLRGMDDKRMTQPHIAGFPGGNGFRQMVGAVGESTSRVDKSQRFTLAKQLPRRIQMAAQSQPGRRVVRADVAEQEQQQQYAFARGRVHDRVADRVRASGVDVPADVAWIFSDWEADRESPQSLARHPAAYSGELIECRSQPLRVGRRGKRWVRPAVQADDRLGPG